ncbi:MAG TPA: 3-oxoadipyl-CoA thiolase [Bacteroidales bacterium]|nr:3-oxoadipyl-CoA thiolase [Bacteroidales bacterium]
MYRNVFICDAVRTPIGKYGGALSSIRTDDLAAIPINAIVNKHPEIDWLELDDVIIGCANQAGEDNRNVARMALLLAGLSETIPGVTINRLCGSGMEAIGLAARAIAVGEADLIIAGGVESMSRAPFVISKAVEPFDRNVTLYDTTIGWRFINKKMQEKYGVDSMIETAENLAEQFNISREAQDLYAYNSQLKVAQAQQNKLFDEEIIPVNIIQKKGETIIFDQDEHPRLSSIEKLASLKPIVKANGTVTAGNSSGVNDGAAALIIASEAVVKKYNLTPLCRIIGMQAAGVMPRIMGIGPVYSTNKLLHKYNLTLKDFDIIEINEAFAVQVLACLKLLNLHSEDIRINKLGGAIALGHPLGMSGARLVLTASYQLKRERLQKALCTMCVGVGQGVSIAIETV